MKKIGLLTDITSDNKISLNLPYFRFAERFGAVTLLHPWESDNIPDLDLLIIPGGSDVQPLRYQQVKIPWLTQNQNGNFEYWDLTAMPKFIEKKTPIYGICRAHQSLNVHFGGTLHQHVYDEPTSENRSDVAHYVRDVKTNQVMLCNGMHHQAIDKLGDGFEVTLQGFKSVKKKGLKELCIEGIRHKELPIIGGQFHLEELLFEDEKARPLIDWSMNEIFSIMR